jgi:hypothetical protein
MKNPDQSAAMVFSDGVWYDPQDQRFKMWYLVGQSEATGYATSTDGLHWQKPALDVRPPTNIVQPGGRDSSTVWLDLEEKDPARRSKMFRVIGAGSDPVTDWNNWQMAIHFSSTAFIGASRGEVGPAGGPQHGVLESVPPGLGLQRPACLQGRRRGGQAIRICPQALLRGSR